MVQPHAEATPVAVRMVLPAGDEAAGTAPPGLPHRRGRMVALLQVQHVLLSAAARQERRCGSCRRSGGRGIPAGRLVNSRPVTFAARARARARRKDAAAAAAVVRKADIELLRTAGTRTTSRRRHGRNAQHHAATTAAADTDSTLHRCHGLDGSFGALSFRGGQGHREYVALVVVVVVSAATRCCSTAGSIHIRRHGPPMRRGRWTHDGARSSSN